MSKPDDLEAVRIVAAALIGFSLEDQERICRWARERASGAPVSSASTSGSRGTQPPSTAPSTRSVETLGTSAAPTSSKDLKTFVNLKDPKSDNQFAATVAYFYRFESPEAERKEEIDALLLQNACRLAGRKRLNNPLKTLQNARQNGLLDSGSEAGKFTINTVGENLVAMTLPGQSGPSTNAKRKKPNKPAKAATKSKK